jgi:class 3 adenylate cyclase
MRCARRWRADEILRDSVATHSGHVVKTMGDGLFAVFATAHDALDVLKETQPIPVLRRV